MGGLKENCGSSIKKTNINSVVEAMGEITPRLSHPDNDLNEGVCCKAT
jgi:hypothetical protein